MSCSGTCSGYSTSKGGGGKGTKRLGWSWNILDVPYFLIFLSNFFHDCFTFELLSSLAEVKLFVRDSKLEDGPRQRGLTFVGLAHGQGLFWLVISCYFNFMLFMYNHVYIYNYIIIYIYIYVISAALPWLVAAWSSGNASNQEASEWLATAMGRLSNDRTYIEYIEHRTHICTYVCIYI